MTLNPHIDLSVEKVGRTNRTSLRGSVIYILYHLSPTKAIKVEKRRIFKVIIVKLVSSNGRDSI